MSGPHRVQKQQVVLTGPAIAVHGGAGTFERVRVEPDLRPRILTGMQRALDAAWHVLATNGPALDAVVAAVSVLEDDGAFNAGRGAVTTSDGTIELDAAVMDGSTGAVGGICAATWPANPVQVARALADGKGPVLLAGPGADRLAAEIGASRLEPPSPADDRTRPVSDAGTVGAVALDAAGHLAVATSTGGRAGQRPGRVGDSAVVGAGTWADDRTAAVSATGAGEAFLVAGFAHHVDWLVRTGGDLHRAATAALAEVASRGGSGGAIVLGPDGELTVLFDTQGMARGWRDVSGSTLKVLEPEDD